MQYERTKANGHYLLEINESQFLIFVIQYLSLLVIKHLQVKGLYIYILYINTPQLIIVYNK